MLSKSNGKQQRIMLLSMDEIVPRDHFLRKLSAAVDFSFIYDIMEPLYSNNGRPSVDPVVLVKMLLIGFLYGIKSERRLEDEVRMNAAYRWFLGMDFQDHVPDHCTISQNRRRRFCGTDVFREIFERIVRECINAGLVGGKCVVMDSTHVRANADNTKSEVIEVMTGPSEYLLELDREVKKDELRHPEHRSKVEDREPFNKFVTRIKTTKSLTDPDCGWMSRPGKPRGFYYLCHEVSDDECGIITDVYVTPGSVNDSTCAAERIIYQKERFRLPVGKAGMDGAYDMASVHDKLWRKGITAYVPIMERNKRAKDEGRFSTEDYILDELHDRLICPSGKYLRFDKYRRSTTDQSIQKIYSASPNDCKRCPRRSECLPSNNNFRQIGRPVQGLAMQRDHKLVGGILYREIMYRREVICEGNFSAQKRNHNLSHTYKRGRANVTEHCLFSAMALNLKRLVKYGKPNHEPTAVMQPVRFLRRGMQKAVYNERI